jgi:gamma-glutamyltranspeptidase/glutathione hydrolase
MRSTRPTTLATRGMVATPHYLASAAGLSALRTGGNAVDAAVTAGAVLAVVYPHMCSVGGDAFAIVYDARDCAALGLNGSGRAPLAATRDRLVTRGMRTMPIRGPLSLTVPGVPDVWEKLLARYGSWTLAQALGPAISYARGGFPITPLVAAAIRENADVLAACPGAAVAFLPDGRPPPPGASLTLPRLADTLDLIAKGGAAEFYRGTIGAALARYVGDLGGWMSAADLSAHRSDWVEPLAASYRGVTVMEMPPNSQGLLALLILRLVEGFDLGGLGHNSAASIHVAAEAKKRAFAVAERWVTDPSRVQAPVNRLLGQPFVNRLRASIHLDQATTPQQTPVPLGGDTVYVCAVDADRNACSLIQSVYFPFGSGLVDGQTGVLLQNRGAYFSLDPRHANRLEPGKRTFHTLIPGLALRDGKPWLVFGTMGADGQPQTHVQLLSNVLDHGMEVQAAIEAPRWRSGRFFVDERQQSLFIERGIATDTAARLKQMGHQIRWVQQWDESMGHAQAIMIDHEAGVLHGGADPRGDGVAIGF